MKSIIQGFKNLFQPELKGVPTAASQTAKSPQPAPAQASAVPQLPLLPDITVPLEKYGSDYGGWAVVSGMINSDSVIYSFGVGEDATFDIALIEKFGVTVHAFDPTPKSIAWVQEQNFSNRFVMHPYGIAAFDGEVSFNPPVNPNHVSHTLLDRPATKDRAITVSVKQLATILKELGHDHIDLLKMDIEGAEYDVIENLAQTGIRPRQWLIEFHHRFPGVGLEKSVRAIDSIRSMGYQLCSISARKEEFGFIHQG